MKVKDLYEVLSSFQDIQIWNARTAEPWGSRSYIDDRACDITTYEDNNVFGIAPKVDSEGKTYLAILVDMNEITR